MIIVIAQLSLVAIMILVIAKELQPTSAQWLGTATIIASAVLYMLGEINNRLRELVELASMDAANKLPPHAHEAEEALVGCAFLDPETIAVAASHGVTGAMFYTARLGWVLDAATALAARGIECDYVTIQDELRRTGHAEGVTTEWLAGLVTAAVTATKAGSYAMLIKRHATAREIIRASEEAVAAVWSGGEDPAAVAQTLAARCSQAAASGGRGAQPISTLIGGVYDTIVAAKENPRDVSGIPTYHPAFDAALDGWEPATYHICCARPSQGKTALTVDCCLNAAEHGYKVRLYLLEMGQVASVRRMIAARSGVPMRKMKHGHISDDELHDVSAAVGRIGGLPLWIHTGALSLAEYMADINRAVRRDGVDLVLLDYVALLSDGAGEKQYERISAISNRLAPFIHDSPAAHIINCQLSRGVEGRENKMPGLADLRDSGQLEQDADTVVGWFRPWFYNPSEYKPGELYCQILKGRDTGAGNSFRMHFDTETMRFGRYEDYYTRRDIND